MPRLIKFKQLEEGLDLEGRKVREEWGQEFELRWPVYEYVILENPAGGLRTVLRYEGLRWPWGGVFAWKGWAEREDETWTPTRTKTYDPVEASEEILQGVTRLDLRSPEALLEFVNTWGCLGVGVPGATPFLFDGVALTRHALRLIRNGAEWLHNLRRGQAEGSWEDFAISLNAFLVNVHPAARPTKGGLRPVYRVSRLLDALCLRLWMRATEGHRFRRCPECKALFVPGRRDQRYCARLCTNRANVRQWRRQRKPKR